jgi:hypothetical protein
MVLIVVLQYVLREPIQLDAVGSQILDDLVLVDRMGLVETNDRLDAGVIAHPGLLTSWDGKRTARTAFEARRCSRRRQARRPIREKQLCKPRRLPSSARR